MSGRASPVDEAGGEQGIPSGVYVNPDTLPHADPMQVIEHDLTHDSRDVAPARGHSAKINLKKMGSFLKKGTDKMKIKKKTKDQQGPSQLGDVLGRHEGSSVASSGARTPGGERDDVLPQEAVKRSKVPKLSSFRNMFHREERTHEPSSFEQPTGRGQPPSYASAKFDVVRSGVRNFFKGPPAPSPPNSPEGEYETEVAPLNPPPPRSPCRITVVMIVMFVLMIITGIILLIAGTGDGRVAERCKMLGPCFLGLGLFVLIGEIFFMLFWKDDPLPMLNNTMVKVNEKIGAVQDPYGHKKPQQNTRESYYPGLVLQQYVGLGQMPASPTAKESVPMYPLPTRYNDLPPPPPIGEDPVGPVAFDSAPDPYGPATLDYGYPSGPAAFDYSAPGGPAAPRYDDPPSRDESLDMRVRTGQTPSPGVHNGSYQADDSYQNRII